MTTNARSVMQAVEAKGGAFFLVGDRLTVYPREVALAALEELRLHKAEIIKLLLTDAGVAKTEAKGDEENQSAAEVRLDALREPFVQWFDQKVWLDAASLARRDPNPKWVTAVNALHRDCAGWMAKQDQVVPPTRDEFLQLLEELGSEIRQIAGEEFVANVALKSDFEAQRNFETHATREPDAPGKGPNGALKEAPAAINDAQEEEEWLL
jgi:hypothetical protein